MVEGEGEGVKGLEGEAEGVEGEGDKTRLALNTASEIGCDTDGLSKAMDWFKASTLVLVIAKIGLSFDSSILRGFGP